MVRSIVSGVPSRWSAKLLMVASGSHCQNVLTHLHGQSRQDFPQSLKKLLFTVLLTEQSMILISLSQSSHSSVHGNSDWNHICQQGIINVDWWVRPALRSRMGSTGSG